MKKLMLFPILFMILLSSCTESIVTPTYTSITADPEKAIVEVGDTFRVSLRTDDDRTLNPFLYTLSKEEILSETSRGSSYIEFKAEKKGKVIITIRESATGKEVVSEITVKGKSVPLQPLEPSIGPDKTGAYDFTVHGDVLDVDSGTNRPFQDLDRLILEVTDLEGNKSFNILAASESGKWWLYDEEGRRAAEIDGTLISSIRAYYAPSYETREGKLERKIDFHGRVGRLYPGDGEFLISEGVIDSKNGSITFDFERDYSTLSIMTRPNTRIRVNITGFTSAEPRGNQNSYSETILTADGKVNIHGSWADGSEIQIIYAQYGRLHEVRRPMPKFEKDKVITLDIELPEPELRIEKSYLQAENFMNWDMRDDIYYFPGQIDQGVLHLCWAASSSFMLNWWTWQNAKNPDGMIMPSVERNPLDTSDIYSYSRRTDDIFRVFMTNFLDQGFDPILAMRWFLSGEITPVVKGNLQNGSNHQGFFSDSPHITDLIWDFEENYSNPMETGDEIALQERYRNVSREIYGILSMGNPIVVQNHNHAFNIWAAGFDTQTGLVTELWISNSNGSYIENRNPLGIGHISVSLKDGSIVLNMIHKDQGDGVVHAPDDEPLRTFATIIRGYGEISYITDSN